MTTPEQIIETVRRYGSNARDLRDAAHEACHAIETDVPRGQWNRDAIHDAIMGTLKARDATTRSFQLASIIKFEITARAVERLVCQRFGQDIGDWADITLLEALQGSGIRLPSVEWIREQVDKAVAEKRTAKLVEQILALPNETLDATKPRARRARKVRAWS